MRLKPSLALLLTMTFILPTAAYVHSGHDHDAGLMQGMVHPLSGLGV